MRVQNERKNKAAQSTILDAVTMRTLIATVIAVFTAALLHNYTNTSPSLAYNLEEPSISRQVSAVVSVPETQTDTPPPADEPVVAPAPVAKTVAEAPQPAPTATCASEIGKYSNWNQSVAQAVMMAESGGNANTLNNNLSTGDYSIGCFQINLLGSNLYSKHRIAVQLGFTGAVDTALLTDWLQNPVNNVAMANRLYTDAGQWSDWRITCSTKVSCY